MSDNRKSKKGKQQHKDKPAIQKQKKESILDLAKYMNTQIYVKYQGGRLVKGILKGYDPLQNMVLDEVEEVLRDTEDLNILTDATRNLGLVVVRGTAIQSIYPHEGTQEIDNPF